MPNGASSTSHKKAGGGSSKKVSTASPSTSSSSRRVSGGSKGGRKGGANTRPTTGNASAKGGMNRFRNLLPFGNKNKSDKQQEKEAKKTFLDDQRVARSKAGIQTLGDKVANAKQTFNQKYDEAKQKTKSHLSNFAKSANRNSTRITKLEQEVKDINTNCCPKKSEQPPTSPTSPTPPTPPTGGRRK
jgi:hypothetical protein